MSMYITKPGTTRPAHDADLKQMMGLDSKAKWHPDGHSPRTIQGIDVWVLSLDTSRERHAQEKAATGCKRQAFHRARAACPLCGCEVSVARLKQHTDAHREMRCVITDDRSGEVLARYILDSDDLADCDLHAVRYADSVGFNLLQPPKGITVTVGCADFTVTLRDTPDESVRVWQSKSYFRERE